MKWNEFRLKNKKKRINLHNFNVILTSNWDKIPLVASVISADHSESGARHTVVDPSGETLYRRTVI